MSGKRVEAILNILEKTYGNPGTALKHSSPFELMIATILSAQCTDERVNKVTPELFYKYRTPEDLSKAEVSEIEGIIKSCGLYRNKAQNLVAASKKIVNDFGGRVPAQLDKLLSLPGVGRKTANVILSNAFNKDAIAVDTHVFRVANRLELVKAKNPLQTEQGLMRVIPKAKWSQAHHWLIFHGRNFCKARKPACAECPLRLHCNYKQG